MLETIGLLEVSIVPIRTVARWPAPAYHVTVSAQPHPLRDHYTGGAARSAHDCRDGSRQQRRLGGVGYVRKAGRADESPSTLVYRGEGAQTSPGRRQFRGSGPHSWRHRFAEGEQQGLLDMNLFVKKPLAAVHDARRRHRTRPIPAAPRSWKCTSRRGEAGKRSYGGMLVPSSMEQVLGGNRSHFETLRDADVNSLLVLLMPS